MKKIFALRLVVCFISAFASLQKSQGQAVSMTPPPYKAVSVPLENNMGTLHIMSLTNGLTIFVKEDTNSAVIRTEFVCKAGMSSQSASNAGFFKLYANLFPQTSIALGTNVFKSVKVTPSCNADSATYTADCTPGDLEDVIKAFSQCAMQPLFSDEEIQYEYDKLKKEVDDYATSTTGFINSAIDGRVFSQEPWKQDSGIYPALFSKYSPQEVRTVLMDIAKRYYTPDNSAIFITGNISAQSVYNLALKYFSLWSSYYEGDRKRSPASQGLSPSSGKDAKKKFVLTDPSFSKDLTQIVIQYTSLPMTHADIAAAAFNSSGSAFKKGELASPVVSIRSKDYLNAASAQRSSSSRLILQALLEKPYLFASAADKKANKEVPSPADQCELFAAIAKNSASFSEEEFITAQNSILAKYLKLTGDSVECMKLLADWWALDSSMGSEGFYERFLNLMRDIKFAERQQIADEIKKEEPYTFVLLNSEVYQKSKAAFDQKGYTHITTQNASWYSDELEIQKALQMEQKQLRKAERQMSAGIEVSPLNTAEYFFYKNAPLIQTTKLANGIPLTVKTTADSRTALLSIAISGGECSSPEKERLLRTVMVNSFARNIQTLLSKQKQQNTFVGIPEILAWTQQRVSYITIECLSCDLPAVFKAASDAVIFGEMDAVIADSLVHEQKAQWASTIIGLGNQLNFNALKYLYRGTPYERLYDTETEVLKETSLSSITNAYTHLLNATLYSLVVVGDVKFNEIEKYAESSFGILKSIGSRAKAEFPKAEFKNKTRRVQLRHLYATDKTPEMAPNGVPILVPTKDFFDPVLYYFQCPEEKKQRVLFNALLIELSARTQEFLKAQKDDIKCSYTLATPSVQVGMLKADAVLHTNNFYSAYKKAFNSLKSDLTVFTPSEADGDAKKKKKVRTQQDVEKSVKAIKTKWISGELSKTQTNSGTAELIQQGLLEGNATEYLSNYVELEKATDKMFLEILERYLPEDPIFKVFSVDSKK